MERWAVKLICLFATFIISIFCTLIPFKMSSISCKKCRFKSWRKKKGKLDEPPSTTTSVTNGDVVVANATTGASNVDAEAPRTTPDEDVITVSMETPSESSGNDENDKGGGDDGEEIDERVIGVMMCFGGGVFFGTYLLHMAPEVKSILESSLHLTAGHYPIAEIITGGGFFFVLTVDQLVSTFRMNRLKKKLKQRRSKENENRRNENGRIENGKNEIEAECSTSSEENSEEADPTNSNHRWSQNGGASQMSRNMILGDCTIQPAIDPEKLPKPISENNTESSNKISTSTELSTVKKSKKSQHSSHHHQGNPTHNPHHRGDYNNHHNPPHPHHHHHQNGENDDEMNANLIHSHQHQTRSIVLVLALSMHHIFEGLSIGLQEKLNSVWHLALAVMCHETAICFSMGLQFYKTDKKLTKKVFVILLVACLVMPVGLLIGLAISEAGGTDHAKNPWQEIVNGVLQALACGTFIYVTFFEILFEELNPQKATLTRILSMAFGFTFMALLGLIPEGESDVHIHLNTTEAHNYSTVTTSKDFYTSVGHYT